MKKWQILLPLLLVTGFLSGCATQSPRSIEVTRFHLNQDIAPQEINLEPATGVDDTSLEYTSYANAVKAELAKVGLTVVDGYNSDVFATVNIGRQIQQKAPKKSKFSIGIGGGSYGGGSGVSGGVNVPVGGSSGGEALVTTLEVKLIRRNENAVSWEGEAIRSVDTTTDGSNITVEELAAALFNEFPGDSGKTVTLIPDNTAQ